MKVQPTIKIKNVEYKVEDIYITELGYLMVKVFNEKEKVWTNHNLGMWDEVLNLEKTISNERTSKNNNRILR